MDADPSGSTFGHYQIQAPLGAGGMGRVYAARDTRLNRMVALKVLSARGDVVSGALAREAQAASALNHPNIVTIYEIGEAEGTAFLAMEHVAGRTLHQVIGGKAMEPKDALRIAVQIASALAAAHEAGVVHRDLKPGNVMVTERGIAKVLDFGLAKRLAADPLTDPDTQPTATILEEGKIAGTVAYMSPEQVQGKEIDARSDIFSFGCVLYEMLTGRRAFHRETNLLTLAAVVSQNPQPAHELSAKVPERLERILDTCLRKDRLERWQNMADVKLLLEDAARDLDAPAAAESGKRKWLWIATAAVAGAVVVVVGSKALPKSAPAPEKIPVVRRVTADGGLSAYPTLSRDGSLLAFASDRGKQGHLDIWLKKIGGREFIQLTHDEVDCSEPDYSPDGSRVAYRSERDGGGVYVVPSLGGDPALVAPGGRNPRFSPDGRWLAYWKGSELGGYFPGSASVYVIEAGGGAPRQLGKDSAAMLYPVWSPRSDAVLALGVRQAAQRLSDQLDWWVLPLDGGDPSATGAIKQIQAQRLTRPAWQPRLLPLAWWDDGGNRLLFAAAVTDENGLGDTGNLWEIRMGTGGKVEGPAIPVTAGPGQHLQAAAAWTPEVRRLAFADLEWQLGIWSMDLDSTGRAKPPMKRVTESEWYAGTPSLSTDGKILAFLTQRLGRWSLRSRDLSSGKELEAVYGGRDLSHARVSGDGSVLVYSDVAGSIFTVPRGGGRVDNLCEKCGHATGVSPDGTQVCYEPNEAEDLTVLDVAARKSVVVAKRPAGAIISSGQFSPDGKWLAFHAVVSRDGVARIWIVRSDGERPVTPDSWVAVTDGHALERDPAWSPDGGMIYYLSERDGFRCIWARKLDAATKRPAGEPFPVAHFHSSRHSLRRTPLRLGSTGGLAVAGGRMVFSFGELTGDIWMEERPR